MISSSQGFSDTIQEHPHDQARLPRMGEVAQTVVREGAQTIGGEGMQIAVGEGEEVQTIVEEGEMQTIVEDGEHRLLLRKGREDGLLLGANCSTGESGPERVRGLSFASGNKSGNNFTSTLALSRGSMVSGADNLGEGVDRIWGRTCRHFCPTCDARGEERTSSSLLRAGAWGCFRDFCLNFSALCPYTSCG